MQLGKALLGGIIGAAVGVGLLVVVFLTLGIDKVWLAIPFAIITGLGVRMLVRTAGHASYARGALTALLALVAYVGGWFLVAAVASHRSNAQPRGDNAMTVAENHAAGPGATTDAEPAPKDEAAPTAPPQAAATHVEVPNMRTIAPVQFSTWECIWLAIAAFVAYEMGRGSGMATGPAGQPAVQTMAAGTHPDA